MRRGSEQLGIHTSSCSAPAAADFMPGARSYRRGIDAYGNQLLMIIKGLFRRYERWNPVHPTTGAFWGMGIGVGCGVGWGPGFGPEVIGYVGAGCGVGFSVGFTLAGVGIGLPMNGVVRIPYDALEFARPNALTTMRSMAGDSWSYISPQITFLKKEACRLPSFKTDVVLAQQVEELSKLNKTVMTHIGSMLECFKAFQYRCRPPGKGT